MNIHEAIDLLSVVLFSIAIFGLITLMMLRREKKKEKPQTFKFSYDGREVIGEVKDVIVDENGMKVFVNYTNDNHEGLFYFTDYKPNSARLIDEEDATTDIKDFSYYMNPPEVYVEDVCKKLTEYLVEEGLVPKDIFDPGFMDKVQIYQTAKDYVENFEICFKDAEILLMKLK